jgi:hypothetical protein
VWERVTEARLDAKTGERRPTMGAIPAPSSSLAQDTTLSR